MFGRILVVVHELVLVVEYTILREGKKMVSLMTLHVRRLL
jgi:hypothetical protein